MNTAYIQFPRENIPWSTQPDKRVDAQSEIVVSAERNHFAAMSQAQLTNVLTHCPYTPNPVCIHTHQVLSLIPNDSSPWHHQGNCRTSTAQSKSSWLFLGVSRVMSPAYPVTNLPLFSIPAAFQDVTPSFAAHLCDDADIWKKSFPYYQSVKCHSTAWVLEERWRHGPLLISGHLFVTYSWKLRARHSDNHPWWVPSASSSTSFSTGASN